MQKEEGTSAPHQLSLIEVNEFRQVMRQLVGCVTVITTKNAGVLHGFTATAVCSVCADPPTILIAVNRTARTHDHIDQQGSYAVNILNNCQSELASHFASKGDDQFTDVDYEIGETGVPILSDAAASLECVITEKISIGTHTLFVGQVVNTKASESAPLIYHDGRYAHSDYNLPALVSATSSDESAQGAKQGSVFSQLFRR